MAKIHYIPFGTTEPQDFSLRNNGSGDAFSDLDVGLQIERKDGEAIETAPAVAWLDQDAGTVRVTFDEPLPVGSYLVRFSLTDSGALIGFVPNGKDPDIWAVVDP